TVLSLPMLSTMRCQPRFYPFPYTTLFRSDGVEAPLDEAVEQLERGGLVGGPAEDVAAEYQRRDIQAGTAERSLVHDDFLCVLPRSEEHTSELQSRENLVCRLLLDKKNYGS